MVAEAPCNRCWGQHRAALQWYFVKVKAWSTLTWCLKLRVLLFGVV